MDITLSEPLVEELRSLLDATLGDLSSEIAATDNPEYRQLLKDRRERLEAVGALLGADTGAGVTGPGAATG
jgi:hypothetical protein